MMFIHSQLYNDSCLPYQLIRNMNGEAQEVGLYWLGETAKDRANNSWDFICTYLAA